MISFSDKPVPQKALKMSIFKTFNEFQEALLFAPYQILHPSEKFNQEAKSNKNSIRGGMNSNFLNIINSNHFHCNLCNEHFYCYSDVDDINSFFQKHINTNYHKSSRCLMELPNTQPMFTWEKYGITARCNICELSGINAMVFNTKLEVSRIISYHVCFIRSIVPLEETYRFRQVFMKFCNLSLFKKIFLECNGDQAVCLLCCTKTKLQYSQISHHFMSEEHCRSFLKFIDKIFNFTLKDLLNGFHLEQIVQWMWTHSLRFHCTEPKDCQEETLCLQKSNDTSFLYANIQGYIQFFPKHVEDILENCSSHFFQGNTCLICQKGKLSLSHATSKEHVDNLIDAINMISQNPQILMYHNRAGFEQLMPYRNLIEYYNLYKATISRISNDAPTPSATKKKKKKSPVKNHSKSSAKPNDVENTAIPPMDKGEDKKIEALISSLCSSLVGKHDGARINSKSAIKNTRNDSTETTSSVITKKSETKQLKVTEAKSAQNQVLNSSKKKLSNVSELWNISSMNGKKQTVVNNLDNKLNTSKTNDAKLHKRHNRKRAKKKSLKDNETVNENCEITVCSCNTTDTCDIRQERRTVKDAVQASDIVETEKNANNFDNSRTAVEEATEVSKTKKLIKKKKRPKKKETDEGKLFLEELAKSHSDISSLCRLFAETGNIEEVVAKNDSDTTILRNDGLAEGTKQGTRIFIENIEHNVTSKTRKMLAKKKAVWEIFTILSAPEKLTSFMMNLLKNSLAARISEREKQKEELVYQKILLAVRGFYPFSRCYPFGSRVTGLSFTDSDVDVFLDCGNMFDGAYLQLPSYEKKILRCALNALVKNKRDFLEVNAIFHARVPIITFVESQTNLHCDLSFKNGLCVRNTNLLRFMISLDSRVQPLILYLKCWAQCNDLHGRPYFSSYALALLMIFYLQQLPSPILPSIETLQTNYVGPRPTIAGWDCNFSDDISLLPKIANADCLPNLLLGFFEFYSNFAFNSHMISPLTGKPLPRNAFTCDVNSLPMSYKRHFHNIPICKLLKDMSPIWVVDPFDISHNVTSQFPVISLKNFANLCKLSAHCLRAGMNIKCSNIEKDT